MIVAGTSSLKGNNLGMNEPSMIQQYRNVEDGRIVWHEYTVGGEVVHISDELTP
jgi:hypothetical protein